MEPFYADAGLRLWHGSNLGILGADALGYPHTLGFDLIEMEADHLPLILQRVRKPLLPSMFGDWEAA